MKKKQVVLGIGSNLGDRETHLKTAIQHLMNNNCTPTVCSSIYESEPWGFEAATPFYNAVILIETELDPELLLLLLQQIEIQMGRVHKTEKTYQSREIDIDILFFEQEVINNHKLCIPHPHLEKRRFVLEPMNEILPQYIHPLIQRNIQQLLVNCSDLTKVKIVHNTLLNNL